MENVWEPSIRKRKMICLDDFTCFCLF